MVAVLRVKGGYSPQYLLKEVATGRENYYTGAVTEGEPPGRWWGTGAERLGLTGLVDAQDMEAIYERFLDPRAEGFKDRSRWDEVETLGHTGRRYLSEDELYAKALEQEPDADAERRVQLRTEAGKKARQNVAFLDVTFSPQKSITLLHTAFEAQEVAARRAGDEETAAAWGQFRQAIEDAIWAGNNAGLAYLAEKAGYSRIGHHGGAAGRFVDAHDWVAASFFQHDSRDMDPQLHIHNALLNRTEGPDGKWRTLDSRAIHKFRGAAGAVMERTTEERATHALGLLFKMRPDGQAREIVGISPEAMGLVSTRRHRLTAKAAELIDAFEHRHGRSPNGLERDRISQQATLVTRRAKSHTGETREQLLDRIDERIRTDLSGGLASVAHAALDARGEGPVAQEWSPSAVIETALADVQSKKAGWTESDLTRAINAALPDYLGTPDGADIARLLDTLTEEGLKYATALDAPRPGDENLPAELRLANGQSVYQAPGARLFATPDHVRTERALVTASTAGGAAALPPEVAQRFLDRLRGQGVELGIDQAAAVRGVLTSGARVESLVGPAGTGKSFVVGTLARAWSDGELTGGPERRVFGLAMSQIATDVLTGEGLNARNVARWLATQDRLNALPGEGPPPTGEDVGWRLRAGDLVVVDESAMADTAALAAIHRHADQAGAKLLLVGDHRQLAAVGAGGGMDLLATSGARYELADARRFRHEWERSASLRLRAGEEGVLREYHQHGRLLDSGTREAAEQSAATAWLADTLDGHRSLLLVDTNEQAARLSAHLRAELVRLGRVSEAGAELGMQGTVAGVGDLVQARRNAWDLAGVEGNRRGPINRETYQVTAVREDGSLEVRTAGEGEELVLPAAYVREHLALGYASTVHAAQGVTVDTTHSVITASTGASALYVGMSRGREANTAHVTTVTGVDDAAQGAESQTLHRSPIATLAGILDERDTIDAKSAVAVATESADETAAVRTPAELLADAAHLAATERTATWLDQLTADGYLDAGVRARIAAEDGAPSLARVLRRIELAGEDAHQMLHDAVAERSFSGARQATNVLYERLAKDRVYDPIGTSWSDWIPRVDNPEWADYLTSLAAAADARTAELGDQAADEAPEWATEAFGPVPDDLAARELWSQQAGTVAAYRELSGHDGMGADVLGPAPQAGQSEAYAAWRAGWRTLGRPEIELDEVGKSDGQLRMRVRAYEREAAWAPRYVGNELAGTHQAADHHRQTAALRRAEADAVDDPAERDRLTEAANQSAALARVLDERAEELQDLDDARAHWYAHTAGTRAAADRAKAELASRRANDTEPEERVTADEWLTAHAEAVADDERHRDVTDADVAEQHDDRGPVDDDNRDVREVAEAEPAQVREDDVRVPSADETADAVERANRALAEMRAREAADEHEATEHRAEELTRWHAEDVTAEVVNEEVSESTAEDEMSR